MMVRCAFCQREIRAGEHFCRHCGHVQPSMVLSAPAGQQPIPQSISTKRCAYCGAELPESATICGHCRATQPLMGLAQQPRVTVPLEPRATTPLEPTKSCPHCGAEAPLWARFCGNCSQSFAVSGDLSGEPTVFSTAPFMGGVSGAMAAPQAPAAFPVAPGVPGAYAGPQAAAPGVPGAYAGPQSGAPGVPSGYAGPQSGAASVPGAPSAPQAGAQPWQQGATAARVAGKGVARGLRYKLLGTVQAKIITAVVAATVVVGAGGATAAYILTRPAPVIQVTSDFHPAGHMPPVGAPMVVLHVTGQDFSGNSSVTFSLDGNPAPGAKSVTSDGKGNITANLTVTGDWRYGFHTLTATDASHYTTKNGVRVEIIPRPVITVMSQYQKGTTPAGSSSTTFHITGKWFSYSRSVTFLLDGQAAPGSQPVQSDNNGSVTTDLMVTDAWGIGSHTLTARDDQGYSTESGMQIAIVHQGEASTPGPHGSPADDASFVVLVTIQGQNSFQEELIITGHPDPDGGSVCGPNDNGQPYTVSGDVVDANTGQPIGVTYQETLTSTCSGSYKSGKLSYTETVTSDQYSLSNGVTCQGETPYQIQSLSGTFSSPTSISGSWNYFTHAIDCDQGYNLIAAASQGASWTGTKG